MKKTTLKLVLFMVVLTVMLAAPAHADSDNPASTQAATVDGVCRSLDWHDIVASRVIDLQGTCHSYGYYIACGVRCVQFCPPYTPAPRCCQWEIRFCWHGAHCSGWA